MSNLIGARLRPKLVRFRAIGNEPWVAASPSAENRSFSGLKWLDKVGLINMERDCHNIYANRQRDHSFLFSPVTKEKRGIRKCLFLECFIKLVKISSNCRNARFHGAFQGLLLNFPHTYPQLLWITGKPS